MGRRKAVRGPIVAVNLEFLDAVHALQRGKTLQRYLRRSSDELQKFGPVGLIKRSQRPPKPLNLPESKQQQVSQVFRGVKDTPHVSGPLFTCSEVGWYL